MKNAEVRLDPFDLGNDLFILLTLFNVDYKTLAAYTLIKIDYPPHKKNNENLK